MRFLFLRRLSACGLLAGLLASFSPAANQDQASVSAVPEKVRKEFQLAPFYRKYVEIGGMPIVSSDRVQDAALLELRYLVGKMVGQRPDILSALARAKVRFSVMAHDEYTTDIPEHAHLEPRVYWDRRARGLGATPETPTVSGGEENLLAFPGDPYPREIIPLHEFAHAIHEVAMKALDPTFDARLRESYEKALAAGLWKGTYAAVNRQEYWAEVSQSWFDNNAANDALHNDCNTRAKLKAYDAGAAKLCEEVYGDGLWRYRKPADRSPEDRAHLAGFDFANAPRFEWRRESVPPKPRVSFQCAAGELELEFDLAQNPAALEEFLKLAQAGAYSGGRARVQEEAISLKAAARTPSGDTVPEGAGQWTLQLGARDLAKDGKIIPVRIVKGAALLPKMVEASGMEGVYVQRIVRLN